GGSYGIICRPKPYCAGGMGPQVNGTSDGTGDVSTSSGPTGSSCGCDSEFVACAPQTPVDDLHVERSLLVRDPGIIDDPAFRLDTVLGLLAPAGQVDAFTGGFLKLVGAPNTLTNGASVDSRTGFAAFLSDMSPDTAGVAQRLAGVLHITALVNRIDLAKPG